MPGCIPAPDPPDVPSICCILACCAAFICPRPPWPGAPGAPCLGLATMMRATACSRASSVCSLQYSSCGSVGGLFWVRRRQWVNRSEARVTHQGGGKSKSVNPNPFPLQGFGFSPNQPAPRCSRAIAFGDRIAIQSRDRSPKFGPDDRGGSVGAIGASRDGEPRWKTGGARVAMKTPFRLCRSTGRV